MSEREVEGCVDRENGKKGRLGGFMLWDGIEG